MMRPAWTAQGSGPNIFSRNASRLLQPLGVERLANAVAPEDFDHVAAGTPENMEIAGMRIAPERLLHLQRQSFHARRMSVWPAASQTRTLDGKAIIAVPARPAPAAAQHPSRRDRPGGGSRAASRS